MSDTDFAGLRRLIAQLSAEVRELREAVEKLSSQVKHAKGAAGRPRQ
jgi:outer membrane murein-binding lipoprotein Lpp